MAEIKDAVTVRAFLLVLGVAVLQVAFIAVRELNSLPGKPLDATAVAGAAAGVSKLRARSSYGVLVVKPRSTTVRLIAGTIGIGLAILIFVVLGNPSAEGAYAPPLLPAFWRDIGPWLPNGAGTDAVRGIAYFNGASIATDALVIAGYAVAGVVLTYAALVVLRRQLIRMPFGAGRMQPAGD
jgi:hypothetical protein